MTSLAKCSVDGCDSHVQKQGYPLCYEHWKARNQVEEKAAAYQTVKNLDASQSESNGMLSATALGEHFKLTAQQINTILLELGWIERENGGWVPSAQGEKLKAEKILRKNHAPRVVWHPVICKSRILQNAINEFHSLEVAQLTPPKIDLPPEEVAEKAEGFRDRFLATIRASDGHMVRSRGEAMIDGLLYENRIVHAYERLVPIEQTMYCDFFLPEFNLYIEFWGMENNPKYKVRKEKKLDLYRQNGLKLIEVKDEHINNLEDYLMSQLVKFGYKAK